VVVLSPQRPAARARAARNGCYFVRITRQAGHDGQNRHAFEQEQRQLRGAGDLRRRARLPCDALGSARGELTDADARADDGEAGAESRACVGNRNPWNHNLSGFNGVLHSNLLESNG
jgi:hypothetical protein